MAESMGKALDRALNEAFPPDPSPEPGFFTYDDHGRRVVQEVSTEAAVYFAPALRTPDEWSAIEDMTILDPDGWRRDGKDWHEPITHEEFLTRAMQSTIVAPRGAW